MFQVKNVFKTISFFDDIYFRVSKIISTWFFVLIDLLRYFYTYLVNSVSFSQYVFNYNPSTLTM